MANNIKKHQITQEGLDNLNKEYRELIEVKRPANTKGYAMQWFLKQKIEENADYDAAKTEQAEIEKRIAEIKNILDHYEIISNVKTSSSKATVVKIGSKVTIFDHSDSEKYTYEIVGEIEADPVQGKISNKSPLAKAIIGKVVGDDVEVHGIENPYRVKIEKIEN